MAKQPLSVEEILQKQKEQSAFKPKFLSKAERQKQAEAAKQQEEEARNAKLVEEKRRKLDFEAKARAEAASARSNAAPPSHHDGRNGQDERHDRHRSRPTASSSRSNDRYRDRDAPSSSTTYDRTQASSADLAATPSSSSSPYPNGSASDTALPSDLPINEAEHHLIRQRYLGIKDTKRRPKKKPTDKKFVFDWNQDDDTSDKTNPIFETSYEPTVFGAGGRGGLDPLQRSNGAASNGLTKRGIKSAFDEKPWKEKTLAEMKERDWRIFREDFGIAARGGNIPKPLRSWDESSIPRPILEAIAEIGYTEPSPIQRQAIPIGLQNRDLIGIAETGSGKTASFVIPMLAYISELPRLTDENRHLGPYALILAPTRELAQQIEGETRKFASKLGYKCVSIVGGRDMAEQSFQLQDGAEIIIATPGRLKDCVERHVLVLSQCTYVVMDEADRMVNLGFEEVVNFILDSLPVSNLKPDTDDAEDPLRLLRREGETRSEKYRVTMLYSATMPATVERMARKYLRRPATITIGDANQAVGTVEQRTEFIQSEDKKKARLLQILNGDGYPPPIIVFVNQKKAADMLGRDLQRAGWNTAILHSGKTQTMREEALESLRSGECPILVATDLAGRGIDVPDVSLVINYQMANHIEAYVHRIGRTGRAGKMGVAITFLDHGDDEILYELKQEISKSPVSKLANELARHPAAQSKMTRET